MKWLDDFKNAYNGWSRSTQIITMGIGLVFLWSTGLISIVALIYVVLMGKKWWDKRQAQKAPGSFNGNVIPQAPFVPPQPPVIIPPVTQPTQAQVPPPVTPQMPSPPTNPNRPNIDWNKP